VNEPDSATIPGEHPENISEKGAANNSEFLSKPTRKDLEDLKKETGFWQRAS
jgi:hypothetical protein